MDVPLVKNKSKLVKSLSCKFFCLWFKWCSITQEKTVCLSCSRFSLHVDRLWTSWVHSARVSWCNTISSRLKNRDGMRPTKAKHAISKKQKRHLNATCQLLAGCFPAVLTGRWNTPEFLEGKALRDRNDIRNFIRRARPRSLWSLSVCVIAIDNLQIRSFQKWQMYHFRSTHAHATDNNEDADCTSELTTHHR